MILINMAGYAGKPDATAERLKAIQDPQGGSRERGCSYRSPDKTNHTNHAPINAVFFCVDVVYPNEGVKRLEDYPNG